MGKEFSNFGAKHGPTFIGAALDASSQVFAGGEDAHHVTIKAIGHIGTANVGRIAGTALVAGAAVAIGLSGGVVVGVTIVAGFAIGTVSGNAFDRAYDNWGRDIVDNVVDFGRNVTEGIGDAVTGSVGFLKSVFS